MAEDQDKLRAFLFTCEFHTAEYIVTNHVPGHTGIGPAYPGGVFWLNAYGNDDSKGAFDEGRRLATRQDQVRRFSLDSGVALEGFKPEEIETAFWRQLEARGTASLWIVDDVPSGITASDLQRYWFARGANASTLITTRSREYGALLKESLPTGHDRSITRTFLKSIQALGEEGKDFLRLASVLAVAPVSSGFLHEVFEAVNVKNGIRETVLEALDQADSLSLCEKAEHGA